MEDDSQAFKPGDDSRWFGGLLLWEMTTFRKKDSHLLFYSLHDL